MKNINPIRLSFLSFAAAAAVALVLILLSNTTTTTATALAAEEGGCNATRIGGCLGEEEEFLMESETTRRLLAAGKGKFITPGAQNPKKPFCDVLVYGNCINGPRPNRRRPCDYKNTCDRGGK